MSTAQDWSRAYLTQARSDWAVFNMLAEPDLPPCHRLHYLQMTLEKLGKAILLHGGGMNIDNARKSHLAFVKFLQWGDRHPRLAAVLGMHSGQLRAHCKKLIMVADSIERLNPALASGGRNVEYPWEDAAKNVHAPADELFQEEGQLRMPKGTQLLKVVGTLLRRFDELFPRRTGKV